MGLRHHSPTPQGAAVMAVPSSDRHHLPIRHPQPATAVAAAGKAAAAAVVGQWRRRMAGRAAVVAMVTCSGSDGGVEMVMVAVMLVVSWRI
ncbi:hypothetical protein Tco_0029649 [Tanacetum coccineum]